MPKFSARVHRTLIRVYIRYAAWAILVDYIEGLDEVPPRDILDFSKNARGQYFCNF